MPDFSMLIGLVAVSTGAGVIFAAFSGAYFFGKTRARRETLEEDIGLQLLSRVTRVEEIVVAIAREMERVSEHQRFTMRLLSESQKELPKP